MNSKRSSYRGFGVYLLLILAVIGIWYWMDGNTSTNSYTRAQFETAVADGNVAQLKIVPNRGEVPTGNVYITFKDSTTQVLAVNDVNEIEDFLRAHPAIKDVAVIGMPDQRLGEITAAIIEVKEGFACSEEEIRDYCMKLPRYKRPVKIIFADIPRNPTGKIEKPKLRQMYSVEQLVARENEG